MFRFLDYILFRLFLILFPIIETTFFFIEESKKKIRFFTGNLKTIGILFWSNIISI